MLHYMAKDVIIRVVGLHDHQTALRAAPGSTRHLRDELESPLGRAVIRDIQADICRDHTDQPHIVKVQSFGDQLRTDKDIRLAFGKSAQNRIQIFAVLDCI